MSSLCQICGARFYDDDLASNPLSHFCIGLDGPAIVHFETEEHQNSAPHTPEFEKPKSATQPKALALPAQAHAQEDLDEIAKLHQEVDALKAKLQKGHVAFA